MDNIKLHKYESKSYWLKDSKDSIERPQLIGEKQVDFAILGAGYTGLWTAYYLLEHDPSIKIAILDKKVVGYGASGRNGGWCSPRFSVSPKVAIERFGLEKTKDIFNIMIDAVHEVERVIKKENFDVDWEKSGSLKVAIGSHLVPNLHDELAIYHKLGLENEFAFLNEQASTEKVNINGLKGSLFTKTSAVLHPGKLVKKLAEHLEGKGVKIYEHTEVKEIKAGNNKYSPQLIAEKGQVTAKGAVIVAGESFLSQLPQYKRSIIPMYTSIIMTEPLSQTQWEDIGWKNRITVASNHLSVDYLQKTKDGRLLFGLGNSNPYRYGSFMGENSDTYAPSLALQKRRALDWFPMINENQFTEAWGGPIGVTRDWTPNFNFNQQTKVAQAWGYAGQGVSTANVAGRVLSNLIFEKKSLETTLPMVNHTSRKWEPEPFRWLGAKYIKYAMGELDKKSEYKQLAPTGKSIAERLIRH